MAIFQVSRYKVSSTAKSEEDKEEERETVPLDLAFHVVDGLNLKSDGLSS